jgi:sugar lactone lactonase YvrE
VSDAEVVLDGLAFPEGPRWRDGALVFSDMHAQRVVRLDPMTGDASTVVDVPELPSGLGWLPDGRTLFVCTAESHDPVEAPRLRSGRIEAVRVAVAGAGSP